MQHFENLQNWKLGKYLNFCQNAIPKILKKKGFSQKKKPIKNSHLEIQNVFSSAEYL